MFARIQLWIDDCARNHLDCAKSRLTEAQSSIVPPRLIDVGPISSKQSSRLVKISDRSSLQKLTKTRYAGYATLSYAWGAKPDQNHVLTSANENAYLKSLPRLPKTIEDAVQVCRRVGIGWLWVDALCITQSRDGQSHDWEIECPRVGVYYNNALLNIAACWSTNNEGGCLPTQKTKSDGAKIFQKLDHRIWHFQHKMRHRGEKLLGGVEERHCRNEVLQNSPLLQRGWVIQEVALANRLVWFTPACVYWECRTTLRNHKRQTPREDVVAILLQHLNLDAWVQIAVRYSAANLSYAGDRLPALSGLCKAMDPNSEDYYIAGVWRSRFREHLAWFIDREEDVVQHFQSDKPIGLPSWSWLSSDAGVTFVVDGIGYGSKEVFRGHPDCAIGRCEFVTAQKDKECDDEHGQIAPGASLKLRAPMCRLRLSTRSIFQTVPFTKEDGNDGGQNAMNNEDTVGKEGSGNEDENEDGRENEDEDETDIECKVHLDSLDSFADVESIAVDAILLSHVCGTDDDNALFLLVKEVKELEAYRRIGLVCSTFSGGQPFAYRLALCFGKRSTKYIRLV